MTLLPSPSLDILFFIVRPGDVQQRTAKQQKRNDEGKGKGGGSCCGDVVDILARFASHCRGRSQERERERDPGYDDYADSTVVKRAP